MSAVVDGGIEFAKVPESDDFSTTASKPEGSLKWETGVQAAVESVRKRMATTLKDAFSNIEDNLLHALANQQQLFLPAKGTFLMKNPKFNKRGDLIVDLEYNG